MAVQKRGERSNEGSLFIDRDKEIDRIRDLLKMTDEGHGSMLLIKGEAGIGKSRLVNKGAEIASSSGFTVLQGRCLDYRKAPYLPFTEMLRDHFGVKHDLDRGENIAKARERLLKSYGSLRKQGEAFLEFFIPQDEPVGAYKCCRNDLDELLNYMSFKGYRKILIGSPERLEQHEEGIDRSDLIPVASDVEGAINPRRLEKIALKVRDRFTRFKHCGVVFTDINELIDCNPESKIMNLMDISTNMSISNGGLVVFFRENEEENDLLSVFDDISDIMGTVPRSRSMEDIDIEDKSPMLSTFELISSFLSELTQERPALIVVEDLQWGDKPTYNLLQYLARAASDSRYLILGSFRSEEVSIEGHLEKNPLKEALQRISREKLFETMELERFDLEQTKRLITEIHGRTPKKELFDQVYKETDGNPLFIIELLKVIKEEKQKGGKHPKKEKDGSAESLVTRRLNTLDKKTRAVLEQAAVLADGITMDRLILCTGLKQSELLDRIDELIELRFLKETEEGFDFEHNKVRETVYELIGDERRTRLHLRAASVISELPEKEEVSTTASLANHFMMGGEYSKALENLLLTSEVEYERFGFDESFFNLKKALQCLENLDVSKENDIKRIRVHQRMGDIGEKLGKHNEALKAYKKAIEISEKSQIPFGLASTYRRIGDIMLSLFDWDRTVDYYLRSLHLSKKGDDQVEVSKAFRGLGTIYFLKGDYHRSMECYIKYMEFPATRESPLYVNALIEMGDIYFQMGDFNQALAYYKLSIKKSEEKEMITESSLSYMKMANVLLKLGEVEDSRRFANWAFKKAKEMRPSHMTCQILLICAEMALELGDMDAAKEAVEELEKMEENSCGYGKLMAAVRNRVMGMYLSKKRDFKGAMEMMDRSIDQLRDIQVPYELAMAYLNYGLIKFQKMDVDGALDMLSRASSTFKSIQALYHLNRTSSKLREVAFIKEGIKG